MINSKSIELQYNFYYYTSEGECRINFKTALSYCLVIGAITLSLGAQYAFEHQIWFFRAPFDIGLIPITIWFLIIVITIRRLNR